MRMLGRVLAWLVLVVSSLAPAEEISGYYAELGLNPFKETSSQHFNGHVDRFSGTFPLTTLKNSSFELPDGGRELLRLNHIDNGTLIPRSNWRAQCGRNGVGLFVTSLDGTRCTSPLATAMLERGP